MGRNADGGQRAGWRPWGRCGRRQHVSFKSDGFCVVVGDDVLVAIRFTTTSAAFICCTSGSVLNLSLVWNWRKNPDATGTKFETALSRNVEAWTAAASIDDAKRASLASRRFLGLSWTPLGRLETQPVD